MLQADAETMSMVSNQRLELIVESNKNDNQTPISLAMILTPVICAFAGLETRIASLFALFLYIGGRYFCVTFICVVGSLSQF